MGALMDSGRVKVIPFWSVRWRGVRAHDPCADPDFLHQHHRLLALPPPLPSHLAYGLSEWLPRG